MTKKSNVKEHDKWLKDGKPHHWSAHTRQEHNGLTEADTEEHKLFVKKIKELLLDYKVRFILNPNDSDYFSKVTNEVIVDDRRCDLFIESSGGKKVCVECQISKLSSNELYSRTLAYLENGYEVMWVRYSGVNYQSIYYWLKDDCNGGNRKRDSELGDDLRLICKGKYRSSINKAFGFVFVKLLKEAKMLSKKTKINKR